LKTNINDSKNISSAVPSVVIEPVKGWASLQLKTLWEYRELLYFLVWRDVKVRYKQTFLGASWAILQPFLTMIVFSIFFGKLGGIPSDGIPYPIFAYTALLPWQFFSNAISQSGNSLISNQELITKVYFPRLVIPISAVAAGIVDFCIAFIILLAMMFYYGIFPSLAVLTLPLFLLITFISALAVSLWLAALNVRYRDVRHAIPFLTQFWLFATPIAYPVSIVPEQWRLIYGINPMVGVVEGFRWALLGQGNPPGSFVFVSIFITLVLLAGGLMYFRRMEKTFADLV
jgi:lipopolysaccharide transport system permease protein